MEIVVVVVVVVVAVAVAVAVVAVVVAVVGAAWGTEEVAIILGSAPCSFEFVRNPLRRSLLWAVQQRNPSALPLRIRQAARFDAGGWGYGP